MGNCKKYDTVEEMIDKSQEIRELLIDVVSKNGGHLAPNLGVVELTMAITQVFDLPKDKVLWDVGHQSYVYKILTDREDQFHTIRQRGGLSPFSSPDESEYDHFISGHAGSALSASAGLAISNPDSKVLSIIGDASMVNGVSMEALNNIGGQKIKNLIIIFNDNEMSIGENVGAISKGFSKIMNTKFYNDLKYDVEKLVSKVAIGKSFAKLLHRLESSVKQFVTPASALEALGFEYLGPIDGHDLEELMDKMELAKEMDGPIILHVKTQKGKGYKHAEENLEKFHGISPFDVMTGLTAPGAETYSGVFGDWISKKALDNDDIRAISCGMVKGTGLTKLAENFSDKVFDVGIAEEHGVTFSAGLAAGGLKPYLAIYSTFLQRAIGQLYHDVAIQKLPIKLIIDRSGIVGQDGKTHQGIFDLSYLRSIPNINIVAPTTKEEFLDILDFSYDFEEPLAIRVPRENVYLNDKVKKFSLGKWSEIAKGNKDIIITTGSMLKELMAIKEDLLKNIINPTIVSASSIRPLDETYLLNELNKYVNIFVIEDNVEVNGFGTAILDFANKNSLLKKINIIGIPHGFVSHGKRDELLEELGLKGKNLLKRIMEGRK